MRTALPALLLVLLLAGCAASGERSRTAADEAQPPGASTARSQEASGPICRPIDLAVLRTSIFDFEPADGLADLLRGYGGTVVVGRIADHLPAGRDVVLRIGVEEVLRDGGDDVVDDGSVHLPFSRGGFLSGTREQVYDIGDFARAIPEGTRVVALVSAASRPRVERQSTLPAGAVLGQVGVQGFYLDTCPGLENALDPLSPPGRAFRSIDALVAGIRRLTD